MAGLKAQQTLLVVATAKKTSTKEALEFGDLSRAKR
jgi:hypothetical protein